ncbi:hypothetical protein TCEL_01698 [Thermobrachium celere DSM 8682]|uniref:Uncharacterized protein n=1 Tax=Thermobrachium celere DSM 8682 TaxID=941824 RepID=R7RNZ9_9CLOT|nr:hypothetical protein TCEL_01698 [Thermobrachium celere DSM 8682]
MEIFIINGIMFLILWIGGVYLNSKNSFLKSNLKVLNVKCKNWGLIKNEKKCI